eukprot:834600-Ditylum_brightwellii.AAC.1
MSNDNEASKNQCEKQETDISQEHSNENNDDKNDMLETELSQEPDTGASISPCHAEGTIQCDSRSLLPDDM